MTVRIYPAPQGLPILHKVRGMWRAVFCGPGQREAHLKSCPSCGDVRHMRVVWVGEPQLEQAVGPLLECPVCGPTAAFWRLLDRRPS